MATHENKPQHSEQIVRRAKAPVVLNSAIASAATSANLMAAVHAARAPLNGKAASTHR
jgi:hypothetical protein